MPSQVAYKHYLGPFHQQANEYEMTPFVDNHCHDKIIIFSTISCRSCCCPEKAQISGLPNNPDDRKPDHMPYTYGGDYAHCGYHSDTQ
ncbi:hypothetical protein GmHk_01G000234 [Glycine max]|nr:hypothetical protein GmHk_01G000234 [Glycine max]